MLSVPEKIIFTVAALLTLLAALQVIRQLVQIIGRGHGRPDWALALRRVAEVAVKRFVALEPTFRARPLTSVVHGLVAWSFMYYILVNFGDVAEGYIPGFVFMGEGLPGNIYRLGVDILSVAALVGMVTLLLRRFVFSPDSLKTRDTTLLHPKARQGIRRDSLVVGVFILVHVGFRFLGASFNVAMAGGDAWQPFADSLAGLWSNLSPLQLILGSRIGWWVALGAIMLFIPYFPRSKHIHLFLAPVNYLLQPERKSPGQLEALDLEDESVEQFGAARLEDLPYTSLLDAYACIMCNRCQDACPAYETGKVLSPAALEINKRYFLNQEGDRLAAGEASSQTLLEFAITPEAVWACTACGACNQVCPVGNEPMQDILDIRRSLVLMDNRFPEELQAAYRGMERAANPWNVPAESRLGWAEGLDVRTVDEAPEAEVLWWVGCAPATDPRAQKTARDFVRVLQSAGVDFAVLGPREQCTGDAARRSGNEYLFFELASANVEVLNDVAPKRIVTTCPHCLHTLKTEYPAFGGHYSVIHHTELIEELIDAGKLEFADGRAPNVTFHDPCYLGRQNGVVDSPRKGLRSAGVELREMPRRAQASFCCGAGGAQMWKEEESGSLRVSEERLREARATGAQTVAVGCPFCMIMLASSQEAGDALDVQDVAEIVAERLEVPHQPRESIDAATSGDGKPDGGSGD